MLKTIFVIFALALISLSCNSASEPSGNEIAKLVLFEPPVVTGIWRTSNRGDALGPWGNPSFSRDKNGSPLVYIAPNFFHSVTTFIFSVFKESRVKIIIARAQLAGSHEYTSVAGAVVSVSKDIIVAEYDRDVLPAGNYSFNWTGVDKNDKPLPAGFYRVYVIIGNEILWNDLFLSRTPGDIPPGLRIR